MLTVFVDRTGRVLLTYPNIDVHTGDKVQIDDIIYLVAQRIFVAKNRWYEVLLHESAE